jgi:Pentapeptide repeats (8 copies)
VANQSQLEILQQSVEAWNSWKERNLFLTPDLSGANLRAQELEKVNFSFANLTVADLTGANLTDADLSRSNLVKTNLTRTTLTGCRIYGINAWDLNLEGAIQQSLNVSDEDEPAVMVDNLEVAQFIYLLLNHKKPRDVLSLYPSSLKQEAYAEARLPRNAVAWLEALSDTNIGRLDEARSTRSFHFLASIHRRTWKNSQKSISSVLHSPLLWDFKSPPSSIEY